MKSLKTLNTQQHSSQLSLYDKYGAMAYGVILQIIPQEQFAQEVLVELFNSTPLQNGNEGMSDAVCILRNARAKAIQYNNRVKSLLSNNDETRPENASFSPEVIFNMSFKQGYSYTEIAEKLTVPVEVIMKAVCQHVKSFRKS